MAFQQGLSGLSSSSRALDAISNNVANSGTVGFKSATPHFADIFANSLAGTGTSQVGIGATLSAVQQQFTQGNITATSNPLDIAINGGGFFRTMSNAGAITYTRNGQFHLDKTGAIVNDQGLHLVGDQFNVDGTTNQNVGLNVSEASTFLSPVATGASTGGAFTGGLANLNLDSRTAATTWVPDPDAAGTYSPTSTTYNYSTAMPVYDSLGNPHTLTLYFSKAAATPGQWEVHANVDGTSDTFVTLTNSTLNFDTSGQLTTTPSTINVSINLDNVQTALGKTNIAGPTLGFDIDFSGSTQFGTAFATNKLIQDGYAAGTLAGLLVNGDGLIQGRYSNGQTRSLAQVKLADFNNPNGLLNLGGNQWAVTPESGEPIKFDKPSTSGLGVLQASAIEESNVDLTAELVNMITQQRNYQANAQSIKTQDSILQTLVNLR